MTRYKENGYQVFPDFISQTECCALKNEALRLVKKCDLKSHENIFTTKNQSDYINDYFFDSSSKISFFFESEQKVINKLGHALHDLNPIFHKFSYSEEIKELVRENLNLKKPMIIQSMVIFKQPHVGGEVDMHQDSTFLCTNPLSTVGMWLALEDSTVQNGALQILPDGHKSGLFRRFKRMADGKMKMEELKENNWEIKNFIPMEVRAGTLVLFDGLLPHYSAPNNSSLSRMAYTLHLVDGSCEYLADNWCQRPSSFPFRSLFS